MVTVNYLHVANIYSFGKTRVRLYKGAFRLYRRTFNFPHHPHSMRITYRQGAYCNWLIRHFKQISQSSFLSEKGIASGSNWGFPILTVTFPLISSFGDITPLSVSMRISFFVSSHGREHSGRNSVRRCRIAQLHYHRH